MSRFVTEVYILPYALPLIIVAAVAVFILIYALRRRKISGAHPLVLMAFSVILWCSCTAFSMYQTDLDLLIFISDIQSVASAVVAPAWMVFAMRYTQHDKWLTRTTLGLLCIEPIIFEALIWTDASHGLMRTANWLETSGPFPIHYSTFGIGYWGHVVYVYTQVFIGTVLIVRELIHTYHMLYRSQIVALVITVSAPWLGNMLQLSAVDLPIPYIMLTPMSFGISLIALAWGFFRYRLLDVVPIAREAVIDSMRDGVVVLDTHGHIVDLNPTAQRMTDRQVDQLIGQDVLSIWPEWEAILSQPIDRNSVETLEVYETDDQIRQYALHLAPIYNRHQVRSGVLVVVMDTTDRKQAEEERLKMSKLESLGVMAAGIAHDFNNTLSGVLGYLSMAKQDQVSAETLESYLSLAEEAAVHAKNLTRQLMAFAKGGEPIKETRSVAQVIQDAEMLVPTEVKIERTWDIAEDLWAADLDVSQITQVIQNLIINAQQAMPDGGTITIRMTNIHVGEEDVPPGSNLNPGAYVKVAIQDEGTGIPPDILDKIFDPYFTTKDAGTGLGLASTYTILQRHEGAVAVQSTIGQGTTFELFLPARVDLAIPISEPVEPPSIPIESVASPAVSEGNILIMDDEPIIRRLASEGLTQYGFNVISADNGEEALTIYQAALNQGDSIDVVILDLTVPGGMGGKEAMASLQEIDPAVKVIVSSGYSNDPVMANYKDYGFLARVVKPYRIKELLDAVNEVMAEKAS